MKSELQSRCELFIENKTKMEKMGGLEYASVYMVSSNLYTAKNLAVDTDRIKDCRKLLKEKTGVFSAFRGNVTMPLVCMLALDKDPENKMDRAAAIYKELREEFPASESLALAAMLLTDTVSDDEVKTYIKRGKAIYKLMKEEHPFMTGGSDSVFAVLLAFSEKKDEEIVSEMEQMYQALKESGFGGGTSLNVSRVFALTADNGIENCGKLKKVFDSLAANGRKYGKDYELGALAGLVSLPVPAEILEEEILEVDTFLSTQKGYGILGYSKKERLMQAVMILAGFYAGEGQNTGGELSTLTGTLAMLAALEMALIVGVYAGVAASSSSSSH
ncbi:MAG: DUF4003 family protein [Parasporobacterium sp.]|nr:DUF4003 family protein [Parasporobacterium sp.]